MAKRIADGYYLHLSKKGNLWLIERDSWRGVNMWDAWKMPKAALGAVPLSILLSMKEGPGIHDTTKRGIIARIDRKELLE